MNETPASAPVSESVPLAPPAAFAGVPALSRHGQYRLWPRPHADSLDFGGGGFTLLVRTLISIVIGCAVLSLPVCTRTTGLSATATWILGLGWGACMVLNDFVLHPLALRSNRAFDLQMAVLLAYNGFFVCAFPVAGNHPQTPLWLVAMLWAGYTGTWQEMEPSWAFLFAHIAFPLATIPVFLAQGADPHWSIAGPLITALICGIGYDQISMMTAAWRQTRQTQAAALARSNQRIAELERQRVARELHDGVGAALALARSSSDLLDLHADSPELMRQVAATLRESSADALAELRVLLDDLAPKAGQPADLTATVRRVAQQFAAGTNMAVEVVSPQAVALDLPPLLQLSAVQIVREALRNALQHGAAGRATVTLQLLRDALEVTVTDDGSGFDTVSTTPGRGLSHIRTRCAEWWGDADIRSTPGGGTAIRCTMRLPGEATA